MEPNGRSRQVLSEPRKGGFDGERSVRQKGFGVQLLFGLLREKSNKIDE